MYTNLSSTAIEVTWLLPEDPNGVIENYELVYTELATASMITIQNIPGTSYNLTGLKPYQQYSIMVFALTDKGRGEGSQLLVLTDEDCKS